MTQRSRTLQFVLLLAVACVLWWRALASTLELALSNDADTHILLIAPFSCVLVYVQRNARLPSLKPGFGAGSAVLMVVLLLAALAKWGHLGWPDDVRLSLSMFALVTWWIGSFVFCFGIRAFQGLLFPLCFLYWLVPIPEFALGEIIYFLQQQSALAARVMFLLIGVPAKQDGIMLSIPGLDIEVVRECSSIRSSLILVITTMVLAHLLLRSWWRKSLLVAAAIPLSFVKNGFRIFVISELGTRVDPSFFDGRLHHQGGIVFLSIALGAVALLLWGLRHTEAPNQQKWVISTARE